MKTCKKCGIVKPLYEFSANRSTADHLRSCCKECSKKAFREWYLKTTVDYAERRRDFRKNNQSKIKLALMKWRSSHKEEIKKYNLEYKTLHKSKIQESHRQWYKNNPEWNSNWRKKHLERRRKYEQVWCKKNSDKRLAMKHRRRALKNNSGGSFTAKEWRDLLNKYGNQCLCCHSTGSTLHADHVIPLALGGTSYISNIQPLCRTCNLKKHIKIHDYRTGAIKSAWPR